MTLAPPRAPRFAVPRRIDPRRPTGAVTLFVGTTMGTTWRVRCVLPPRLEAAGVAAAIEARLAGIVGEMSHWEPGSLLCRFNRARAGSWTTLPPDFAAVIAAALDLHVRSAGAFDAALGRLTDLWGIGATARTAMPVAADIAVARAASGSARLHYDAAARRLFQPGGCWLDVSGIAKGHAVDAVVALLGEAGVSDALVEIGGECAGAGMRPDGDPWWVELETPPGCAAAPLRVALHGLGVATSGAYVRGQHTLDPRTGAPVADGPAAVSVVHVSCGIADGWASALTVLPEAKARAVACREALAVRTVARDGGEWLSPAMADMLGD